MDNHTLAGVVIAVAVIMIGSLFYESDLRTRWEKVQQRRRRRQREKDREKS
jgi:hypothetical protein